MAPIDRLDVAYDALHKQEFDRARTLFQQLLTREPGNVRARLGLADALFRLNQHAGSAYQARQAAKLCRDDEMLYAKSADALSRAGFPEEGVKMLEECVKRHPEWAVAKGVLGNYYCDMDQLDDAERLLRESLELAPDTYGPLGGLARTLALQGRSLEAAAAYRRLIWHSPDDQHLLEQLAFLLNNAPVDPNEVYQAHVKLGLHYANFASPFEPRHPPTDDPERKLNVAFLTHDFNGHSVSFFLRPLLVHADRSGMSLAVYFTNRHADAMTSDMAGLVDRYEAVPNMSSIDLARRILADRVDVLIDLNGWTAGHRMHAMQLRPAPVQLTWLGYPNTTGIPSIDYRVVDSISDPPGSERFATETLLRLDPCFLCYTPVTERAAAVPPGWKPPARKPLDGGRPIVFGSFNNGAKVTDTALETWAEVLARVPDSRLLIKARGFRQEGARRAFLTRMERAGIPPDRAEVMPQTPFIAEHLEMYSSVDIALDTFPYNGTTTTCETLLMGVPVVTIAGDRHVARVGASILTSVGIPELIAPDRQGYIDTCVALAADRAGLAALQQRLPDLIRNSPVCDGPAFGRRFTDMLRAVWRHRCVHGVGAHRTFVRA